MRTLPFTSIPMHSPPESTPPSPALCPPASCHADGQMAITLVLSGAPFITGRAAQIEAQLEAARAAAVAWCVCVTRGGLPSGRQGWTCEDRGGYGSPYLALHFPRPLLLSFCGGSGAKVERYRDSSLPRTTCRGEQLTAGLTSALGLGADTTCRGEQLTAGLTSALGLGAEDACVPRLTRTPDEFGSAYMAVCAQHMPHAVDWLSDLSTLTWWVRLYCTDWVHMASMPPD